MCKIFDIWTGRTLAAGFDEAEMLKEVRRLNYHGGGWRRYRLFGDVPTADEEGDDDVR
jgi:hypothetical protein